MGLVKTGLLANFMPYIVGGLALLSVAAVAGAYFKGRSDGRQACEARSAAAMEKVLEESRLKQERIDEMNAGYVQNQNAQAQKTREIYRETVKLVDRPIYNVPCVDADGVGLLDRAAANANKAPVSKPDGGAGGTSADAERP